MQIAITVLQLVSSVLLIIVVLMQQKGAGLGSAFGGGDAVFTTRRGPEKFVFNATIVLSIILLVSSLAAIFI